VDGNGTSKAATPWGAATLVDELTLPQRAGDKRFASIVQLLEAPSGERLVRFAYSTGGAARRGPVTLRLRDLERLREALADHPDLAEVFAFGLLSCLDPDGLGERFARRVDKRAENERSVG
jgi:hypothetical protein